MALTSVGVRAKFGEAEALAGRGKTLLQITDEQMNIRAPPRGKSPRAFVWPMIRLRCLLIRLPRPTESCVPSEELLTLITSLL